MPLFEFRCKSCGAVTEVLARKPIAELDAVACARCGGTDTSKIISQVTFKVARSTKYSEEFLGNAQPFLKSRKETAEMFAEGKGSDDEKTFQLAERIGEQIDRSLAATPRRRTPESPGDRG